MTGCELVDSPDVEMYFYGELEPADRGRVDVHVRGCGACRQRLEDLHAIRRALASRPAADAPPAGDWSGFMRRLDAAVARTADPSTLRPFELQNRGRTEARNRRTLLVLAASVVLVTAGLLVTARLRTAAPITGVASNRPSDVAGAPPATRRPAEAGTVTAGAGTDRALREGSAEHLERSKLVVLGLASRDPHVRARDWRYERALAGTLLSETRLYRQAAIQDGATDVARVMRDLETVLLEASMSDKNDGAALERVQRLIAKRDLVVKMQVMTAAGRAGN